MRWDQGDSGRPSPIITQSTNKNRNIALLYAAYRMLNNVLPIQADKWRAMLTDVGLDPDDNQENTSTAVGIGNLVANTSSRTG